MEEEEALDPPWAAKSSAVSARSNSDWAKRMAGGREARRSRRVETGLGFPAGLEFASGTGLARPIKYFGLRFPQLGAGADGN